MLDTDSMREFPTGDPLAPSIFVDSSGDTFILRRKNPTDHPTVCHMHKSIVDLYLAAGQMTEFGKYLSTLRRIVSPQA
jgi:hypothetical protein